MRIENEFEVAAPVEQVWRYLLDVPRMVPNLPGAELTEVIDEDNYRGRVVARLGPVSMRFAGTAQIVERDEAGRRLVMNASGSEEKGRGTASMVLTSTLLRSPQGTKVAVAQDVQISGAAAQFGRGMIQDVSTVLMRDFAANIQQDIGRWSRGEAAAQRTAAPVSGFSVGLQAALAALRRFFRRFFGRTPTRVDIERRIRG